VPLGATVLIPADLAELSREAQVIARGRVIAADAVTSGDWRSIETIVTLDVEASLKGATGENIRFRVPGGNAGRYRRVVLGAPEIAVGQRVVVFLGGGPGTTRYVLGLSQGIFRLLPAESGWLVAPPVVQAAGTMPQAIVRGDSTRRAMTLADFERTVRAAAGVSR
jgi:hypothetical protein